MSKKKNQSQTVETMMKNFHNDFQSGLNVSKIAEKYGLDKSYVYKLLGKIAERNAVSREEYLERRSFSRNSKVYDSKNTFTHYSDEDYLNIIEHFNVILNDISELNMKLEGYRKKYEVEEI